MQKFKLLLFFIAFGFVSSLSAQTSMDRLLIRLDSILEAKHIPGAMVSIVRADSVLFAGGVGYASIEREEPVSAQHLFRLGSISKSITALGIMQLIEAQQVELTTPLYDIDAALDFENPWKSDAPITVGHILEHTAGFDDMHQHATYSTSDVSTLSCQSMLQAHQQSLYARWQPGTRMAYSNPGYVVAGYVIEHLTAQPYDLYLKQHILEPLGMQQSGFYFKQPMDLPFAQGYTYIGNQYNPIEFKSIQGGPAGDFCSNAEEMAHYLQFMLKRTTADSSIQIIQEEAFDRIEQPETTLGAKQGFRGGYGLGNFNSWENNHHFHGHDGGIDGFSSIYLYSRTADFAFAVSLNKQGSYWRIVDEILDTFIDPNSASVSPQIETQVIPDTLREYYEGFYRFKDPRQQLFAPLLSITEDIKLVFQDSSIVVKDIFGGIKDTLYYKGDQRLYRPNRGLPFLQLLDKEQTKPAIWVNGGYAERSSLVLRLAGIIGFLCALLLVFLHVFIGALSWLMRLVRPKRLFQLNRAMLWLAVFSFWIMPFSLIYSSEFSKSSSSLNTGSILFFISSILFFACSILAFIHSFWLQEQSLRYQIYYRFIAYSLTGLALFFLFHGFIGLRLWAY